MSKTPLEIIKEYYPHIDAGDIDWVLALFSEQAVYMRADSEYSGMNEIEHFFKNERKITGLHKITDIHQHNNQVVVRGEFIGKGAKGDERRVGFSDFWLFHEDGLVERRETYLATGHKYVKA
jgi:ketosteroid isomerase-like protein